MFFLEKTDGQSLGYAGQHQAEGDTCEPHPLGVHGGCGLVLRPCGRQGENVTFETHFQSSLSATYRTQPNHLNIRLSLSVILTPSTSSLQRRGSLCSSLKHLSTYPTQPSQIDFSLSGIFEQRNGIATSESEEGQKKGGFGNGREGGGWGGCKAR